jgi:hypothetical protein
LIVDRGDRPGTARPGLRQQFGDMPVIFAQGFCGEISPNRGRSDGASRLRDRWRRLTRILIAGPTFPPATPADWVRWSQSLAAAIVRIALGPADIILAGDARDRFRGRSAPCVL